MRMIRGYVQSEAGLQRLRELCIPVRRIYLKGDPINFEKMAELLMDSTDPDVVAGTEYVMYFWNQIREELASTSILNETRVAHGEMFDAWLDAALFQDFADKRKRFDEMIAEYGKSVEGISWNLTERMAEQILQLDEVVAHALGEPLAPPESETA